MRNKGREPVLDVAITKVDALHYTVEYTCPKCKHRNLHAWYGREDHACIKCGAWTNIKGEAPPKPVVAV